MMFTFDSAVFLVKHVTYRFIVGIPAWQAMLFSVPCTLWYKSINQNLYHAYDDMLMLSLLIYYIYTYLKSDLLYKTNCSLNNFCHLSALLDLSYAGMVLRQVISSFPKNAVQASLEITLSTWRWFQTCCWYLGTSKVWYRWLNNGISLSMHALRCFPLMPGVWKALCCYTRVIFYCVERQWRKFLIILLRTGG